MIIWRSLTWAAWCPEATCDQDSLPEWSKGVDSSSTSASCVGSNPTAVRFETEDMVGKGGTGKVVLFLALLDALFHYWQGSRPRKHPPWGSNPRPQG